jgi:hypothetical protein
MGVDASWDPAAFVVARGRLAEQLHPTFIESGGVAKAAARLKQSIESALGDLQKQMGSSLDLQALASRFTTSWIAI